MDRTVKKKIEKEYLKKLKTPCRIPVAQNDSLDDQGAYSVSALKEAVESCVSNTPVKKQVRAVNSESTGYEAVFQKDLPPQLNYSAIDDIVTLEDLEKVLPKFRRLLHSKECLITDADRTEDLFARLGFIIQFMKSTVASTSESEALSVDKKIRIKVSNAFVSLHKAIVELHRISFNIQYMLCQFRKNDWGFSVEEFNHLFDELRDGSWTLKKLESDDLDIIETFRKYMMVLDVYTKVFVDKFFKNWKLLVQLLRPEHKIVFAVEVAVFQHNFCLMKITYDSIRSKGYVAPKIFEEGYYQTIREKFFKFNPELASCPNFVDRLKILKNVFGESFCKSYFHIDTDTDTDVAPPANPKKARIEVENPSLETLSKVMDVIKDMNMVQRRNLVYQTQMLSEEINKDIQMKLAMLPKKEDENDPVSEEDKSEEEYFTGNDDE